MNNEIEIFKKNWAESVDGVASDCIFCEGLDWKTSSCLSVAYKQIHSMALLWRETKEKYLEQKISDCLEEMYETRYGKNEFTNTGWRDIYAFNWWDWYSNVPILLIDILMITCSFICDEKIKKYLSIVDFLVPEFEGTGTNSAKKAKIIIGSSLLQGNIERAKSVWSQCEKQLFVFADEKDVDGQGFYQDGSYIYHTHHTMNGMYGMGHWYTAIEFAKLFEGTDFALSKEKKDIIIDWAKNAFMPICRKGYVYRMFCGRSGDANGLYEGVKVLKGLLQMLRFVDKETANEFKNYIRTYDFAAFERLKNQDFNTFDCMPKLDKWENDQLNIILNEKTEIKPVEFTKMYHYCDKLVHTRDNYSFVVSMSSCRTYNYESIDNANLTGWYLSDGMTNLICSDLLCYDRPYWKNVNYYKLPGTTVDTQERKKVSIAQGNEYLSGKDFVGGAVYNNRYAAVAMDLESYHSDGDWNHYKDNKFPKVESEYGGKPPKHNCTLTAQKAWFCFDDEIVCLGSAINSKDDFDALTIVENRRTDEIKISNDYCYIDEVGGYVFSKDCKVNYERNNNFETIYFNHGRAPENKTYAYTILPDCDENKTKTYAEIPALKYWQMHQKYRQYIIRN